MPPTREKYFCLGCHNTFTLTGLGGHQEYTGHRGKAGTRERSKLVQELEHQVEDLQEQLENLRRAYDQLAARRTMGA